jgi:hypothetical protein
MAWNPAECLRFRLFIYTGDAIDDPETFERLPSPLQSILAHTNGLIAYRGGFHLRGAVTAPSWHGIAPMWDGELSLHRSYDAVQPDDIPFAQDGLGDQYLLRDETVHRLWSETGDVVSLGIGFVHFLHRIQAVPYQSLNIQPFQAFLDAGGVLKPGQLLRSDPPFCLRKQEETVSLAAVEVTERLVTLAALSRTLNQRELAPEGVDLLELAIRGRSGRVAIEDSND